jgi:hypothetical protein
MFRIYNIRFWKSLFHFLLNVSVTNIFHFMVREGISEK